ncbi:VWA domain-containing protein [Rhizobium tumorigenes]|uniref:VWA domain-containing protein n=1 Tax=Rhizobium tumorigenes TaxID=2041385 RepID=A0AAF1KAG2_9HYPH|nr:VWA domain-containing protein [Rhizobium tumorigenes]WFR97579.1 VWA domain-containing protein [Rhizobium tumorigenes]WFS03181.1 VWA domain-containing protein [Rhizobium tumorigenes]
MIEDFHFIRPWWLMSMILPTAILWLASRSTDVRSQWKTMIAPHLLDRLVVEAGRGSRIRPSWLLATVLAFASFGAAGPTWQREAPPFVEDIAPLVIAVDLSPTMDAIDVTPSRIERAKLKIKDIIATRGGARTGVVAYSGSAHVVLPLTEDASLIETYTDALATRIMPDAGKDTANALELAGQMLSREQSSGTILFVTDGVEATAFDAFKRERADGLIVLGIGTAEGGPVKAGGGFLNDATGARVSAKLDVAALKSLHNVAGADVATSTDDDTDVRWIAQRVRNQFAQKLATEGDRWRDMGWWLVVPLALLFCLSFRKGWVVRVSVLLLSVRLLMPVQAEAGEFTDMWLTPDQQGRIAYDRGDYPAAAARFSDPMWRGVAFYRAGKFSDAVDAFASVDSAESWYDQGNAFLHLSKFEEAVAAYRKALDKRKGWPEARDNLAIADRLLKIQKDKDQDQPEEPNEKPDQVQFDDRGKKGKEGQIDIAEQTSEMWMKNIQVSPADLMARKFAIEAGRRKQ